MGIGPGVENTGTAAIRGNPREVTQHMPWERRTRGGRYYTRAWRAGGRLRSRYVGGGVLGEVAANADAITRAERTEAAVEWAATRAALARADAPLTDFNKAVEGIARGSLYAAGFRQHHRAEWRRRRNTMNVANETSEPTRMPAVASVARDAALHEETLAVLMQRASGGDETALSQVVRILDEIPAAWQAVANLGVGAERVWVELVAGEDPLLRTVLQHKLNALRSELEGHAPTALEQLLVERIVVNWMAVQHMDYEAARFFQRGGPPAHASYFQERQEKAQRRYLAAIRGLAQVRRLLTPMVQVNVAERQINIGR